MDEGCRPKENISIIKSSGFVKIETHLLTCTVGCPVPADIWDDELAVLLALDISSLPPDEITLVTWLDSITVDDEWWMKVDDEVEVDFEVVVVSRCMSVGRVGTGSIK